MMKKVAGTLFFASWMLCGCSIETIFEGKGNVAITVVSVAVAIICAWILGKQ